MPTMHKLAKIIGFSVILLMTISGCMAEIKPPAAAPDLRQTAAVEATAIIQQAEATAMLLKAKAQATGLLENTGIQTPEVTREVNLSPTQVATQQGTLGVKATAPTEVVDGNKIEIIRVSFAGEGAYIYVEFLASPKIARTWNQGNISVTEESTGTVYNEIPVAPIIGPLFGRPNHEGQTGYVMLTNAPTPLLSGAQVTVWLGDYHKEHMKVE